MSGDLRGVPNAIALSRATIRNIKENLFWAFAYNAGLIPVAAGALYPAFALLLSPIFAATAMSLSSLFVLGNALRLKRFRPIVGVHAEVSPIAWPARNPRKDNGMHRVVDVRKAYDARVRLAIELGHAGAVLRKHWADPEDVAMSIRRLEPFARRMGKSRPTQKKAAAA